MNTTDTGKRIGRAMLSLAILAMLAGIKVPPAVAQPQAGQWDEPRILLKSADERFVHLSWPKVVRTEEGTIIIACSAGIGHNIGASGPAVARSTDGGATFSEPQILKRFPDDDPRYRDCGNMAMGIAEDGAVVLLAMAYAGTPKTTFSTRVMECRGHCSRVTLATPPAVRTRRGTSCDRAAQQWHRRPSGRSSRCLPSCELTLGWMAPANHSGNRAAAGRL
jgi:hypothetical protein